MYVQMYIHTHTEIFIALWKLIQYVRNEVTAKNKTLLFKPKPLVVMWIFFFFSFFDRKFFKHNEARLEFRAEETKPAVLLQTLRDFFSDELEKFCH